MNKLKITIIIIIIALTSLLFLIPAQPDAVWLKWLSIALWIVLIVIIVRNSDLFERPKVEKEVKPEDVLSPKLLAFLKDRKILDKFWTNYLEGEEFRKRYGVNGVIINIRTAFDWNDTLEGSEFWLLYDLKYGELKRRRSL